MTKDTVLRKGVFALQLLYLILLSVWLVVLEILPSPLLLLLMILIVFLARLKSRRLWADLVPFIVLLLTYQTLHSVVDNLSPSDINVANLMAWERNLFAGGMPSAYLQKHWAGSVFTPFLDVAANLLYLSHFVIPVVTAIFIRQRKPHRYWLFVLGFMLVSYLGFAAYVLFPAAPPWWATRNGYLSGKDAVSLGHFLFKDHVMMVTPNPVAAMPSLHCAYPLYIALFSILVWGRKAAPLLLLPVAVGISVVYLGHHYVVDVLAGYLVGGLVWLVLYARLKCAHLPSRNARV